MSSRALKDLLPGLGCRWFCAGSLPYGNAASAAAFVLDNPSIIPFWPELPNRSAAERMLSRACRAGDEGWSGYLEDEASGLFALTEARARAGSKLRLIKGQVCGPLSFLRYTGKPFTKGNLDRAVQVCLKQIEFQKQMLCRTAERVLVTLDEPGLVDWASMPEEQKGALTEAYSYVYVRAVELDSFLGLHVCVPLEPQLLKLPFDLYSFDACSGGVKAGRELGEALARGAVLAIGAFPSCPPSRALGQAIEEGESRYEKIVRELRIDPSSGQVIRATACGHAGSTEEWVELLYSERQ